MNKEFLTSSEVFVVKGYLSSNVKKVAPIFNKAFVDAQKHAEYVITFADKAKGKDFVGKKADSIEDLRAEVQKVLSKSATEYVKAPEKIEKSLHKQLADEALSFINYDKQLNKVDKVNKFLQQFNSLNEFEEVGLFFEQDIVKLNKIYSISEVVSAVESVIDLLD
jgi:hypothetical protein